MTTTSHPGPTTGVVVLGGEGRLGRFVREALGRSQEFHLAHSLGRCKDLAKRLNELLEQKPAGLALEATVAGQGALNGRVLLDEGLRPVIATSGVTDAEIDGLDRCARQHGLGGLVVPNFSLGMWLLQDLAQRAARHLREVEIIERHHPKKRDAPSGSALDTRARLEALEGIGSVPIHSVRLPGLYAHQEVQFGGPGEILTLRHDMLGPDAFEAGILSALRYVSRAEGVASGIGLAFAADEQKT